MVVRLVESQGVEREGVGGTFTLASPLEEG